MPEPEVNETALAALREPFPDEAVGLLPKVTNKDGAKSNCPDCHNYLAPHIHLNFVGHAVVTDRLLTVDPLWYWEPFSIDGDPPLRKSVNGMENVLWIKLHVAGMTRIGVGVVGAGIDLEKQLISDAIRNAAMRFGVALNLWSKDELESQIGNQTVATRRRKPPVGSTAAPQRPSSTPSAPRSAPSTTLSAQDRNRLVGALAHLPEPVVGTAGVLSYVNQAIEGDVKDLKELTPAQGATLFALLDLEP